MALRVFTWIPGLRRNDNVVKSRHIQSARFFAIRADQCVVDFSPDSSAPTRDDQRLSGTRFKASAYPRPGRRAVHQEDSFLLRATLSPGPRPTPGRPGIESSRLENIFTPPSPSSSSVPSTPSFSELSARDSFLYPLAQRMLAPARPLCRIFAARNPPSWRTALDLIGSSVYRGFSRLHGHSHEPVCSLLRSGGALGL